MTASEGSRFKEMVRDQWTHAAEAWRAWHPKLSQMSREATEAIVDAAALQPGQQVLDLAGGTGEPALTIAAKVAPGGRVTCTDLIPAMVATAEENAQRHGIANMACEQVDAEAIPYADASFDRVTSRFGVMFFPDIQRALGEVRRVLRPDGRVAFTVWAAADQNPGFTAINTVLMARGILQAPEPGAPTPFRFGERGSLTAALRAAGFSGVQESARDVDWAWPGTPAEYLEYVRASRPAMRGLETLEARAAQEVTDEILASLGRYYDGERVRFGGKIYVASAAR